MEEMRREREREYLPTFPPLLQTANFLFTITDDNDESRKGVKKNFFSSSSFFFTFSFFFYTFYYSSPFNFQFSFLSLFHLPTSSPKGRQSDWTYIGRTSTPLTLSLFWLHAFLSVSHHSFTMINDLFKRSTLVNVCFVSQILPSSQYALSVCSSDGANALLT
jgi:hypothetical protein